MLAILLVWNVSDNQLTALTVLKASLFKTLLVSALIAPISQLTNQGVFLVLQDARHATQPDAVIVRLGSF